jgi:hypothetical protein
VKTGLAGTAEVVVVGDVFEQTGFEARVFHARNVQPRSCGLLVYKSYRVLEVRTLYERDSIHF